MKTNRPNNKIFYFILVLLPIIVIFGFELMLQSLDYGYDYSTFVKISDQFDKYKFFNPHLPKKYFGKSKITPSVIADGFTIEKSKNTFRIFALGGSTTAGFPHPPNGSFPRLLKNKLVVKYPDVNFEVINLGISAVNTITIRDLIDDILKEKPDLILLYSGHNEYYGALGPASNISGVNFLGLKRFLLDIKKYKIVQFVENSIFELISLGSDKNINDKTLMSEISGEKLVPYKSEIYNQGIQQFEDNLNYILGRCKEERVQVMLGSLASNYLQTPLCKYTGCDSLTQSFENSLILDGNNQKKKLIEVKEKDQLRFRAPEEFNNIIRKHSNKYQYQIFDVQKSFEEKSENGIIGNNLMMDHLHPTLEGHKYIAEIILDNFVKNKFVKHLLRLKKSKSIYRFKTMPTYTKVDSAFAAFRISILKNDFPFDTTNTRKNYNNVPSCIEESIAEDIVAGNISWENAHAKIGEYYLEQGNVKKFLYEFNVLLEDKPFDKYPYLKAIKLLEEAGESEYLKIVLLKYHKRFQDLFSSNKLGDMYYKHKQFREAIYFYELCDSISKNNSQIYFNLSASYFALKDVKKALKNIEICLNLDPKYPNAKTIHSNLTRISKNLSIEKYDDY